MDASFYTDLVGRKFPSPVSSSTSGLGGSQGGSSNEALSPEQSESSPASSSSGNFENGAAANSSNISEEISSLSPMDQEVLAILSWIEILDDGSSMFNLPLASVDTSLPIAKRVGSQNTVWPRSMEGKPAAPPAPVRDVFTFPPPQLSPEPPFLNIFCHRSFNLVNNFVNFTIQLHNLPREAPVNAMMFEAFVTTPDGRKQACFIEDVDNFMINSFNGSFWADDDGYYEVEVKLIIPMKIWSVVRNVAQCGGIVVGSLDIPVSRSYAEDCQKECLLIHCEYKKNEASAPRSTAWTSARHTITTAATNHRNDCKVWGLTADLRTNMLFYTDRASHEVVCVHPGGRTLFKFGRSGRTENSLFRPTGIAYDKEHGRLVIADKDNHRICFFTTEGRFISSFGTKGHGNGMFNYPWDVDVSLDGQRIVVSDSRNKRVQMFDRFGNFLSKYSVFESNPFEYKTELDYPRGICFDETGKNIYVADFNLHNVVRIPLDFSRHCKMVPDGRLLRPQGIAVDWLGNLLIVDSRNHCIRHVSPQSDLISDIKRVLDKPLDFPLNVATMAGGFVAVLEGAGKIHIF